MRKLYIREEVANEQQACKFVIVAYTITTSQVASMLSLNGLSI